MVFYRKSILAKKSSEYNLVISCDALDINKNFVSNELIFNTLKTFFDEFELVKYESDDQKANFVIKVLVDDLKKIDSFKKDLSKDLNKLEINYYFSNPVY